MESLVGNRPETIPVDKIIHFSGDSVLACVFVLGLRPVLFVPLLLTLVAIGMTVELLQTLTGRQFDLADQYANALGVAVGGAVGLLLRSGHAYLRHELATAQVRRRLHVFHPGGTIYRQGYPSAPVHHQERPSSSHPARSMALPSTSPSSSLVRWSAPLRRSKACRLMAPPRP